MRAPVLFNLSNELGKRYLFRNKFDKFKNTGARMLDSIDHVTLRLLKNCIFGIKTSKFCHLLRNVIIDFIASTYEICRPLDVYRFYCMT